MFVDKDYIPKLIEFFRKIQLLFFYRSLGGYYYERKDYEKTVEYLGKSLELNTFQLKTMLRHGYSAMQLEKWDVAAQSYRDYCVHQTDVSY